MGKVKDLWSCFKQSEKKNHSIPSVPTFLSSVLGNVTTAELTFIGEEIKKSCQPRKHYNTNISESIKLDVGNYAKIYGRKSALYKFQKKYPRHTFLRT